MNIALISDTHYGCTWDTKDILEDKICELSKEDFDILIHAGDWISHEQSQLEPMLEIFRKYIDKPILGVMGNHDFWNKHNPKTILSMTKAHKKLFKQYGIHYLELGPYFAEGNISIWGFDGWYNVSNPPTNDIYYMPKIEKGEHVHDYMSRLAHVKLDSILSESRNRVGTKICVTHFPPYTFNPRYQTMCANENYLDMITENFNYFFVGHSHQNEGWEKNNCKIINSGGDYNRPNYKIIAV